MQYVREEVAAAPILCRPNSLAALGEGVGGSNGQIDLHGKAPSKVPWYRYVLTTSFRHFREANSC